MLKALILFLEAPMLILVSLVNDVHSFDKFIEALIHFQSLFLEALIHLYILVLEAQILFFCALFEYLEDDIQRNRFGAFRLIFCRTFALWRPFIRGILGLCFGAEAH